MEDRGEKSKFFERIPLGNLLLRYCLCALVVLLLPGCGKKDKRLDIKRDELTHYGALPGLEKSTHPGLREELARIQGDRATPALLDQIDGPTASILGKSLGKGPGLNSSNQAAELANSLSSLFDSRTTRSVQSELRKIYPTGRFQFDVSALWRATMFRRALDPERQQFREYILHPNAEFAINHSKGLAADVSFIDVADVCFRLEALWIAQCLHEDRLPGAMEGLKSMFRVVELLAAKRHLNCRLSAARLRLDGLRVLEAIAQHPNTDHAIVSQLQAILGSQLRDWPPDEYAWIGDRALGMHTFELVRHGHLLSFFDFDEFSRLLRGGELQALSTSLQKGIDEDEYYYLSETRRVLESCKSPYWKRLAVLDQVESNLQQLRSTTRRPYIADRFLLTNLRPGHRLQAIDRAATEGWNLALRAALGDVPPSPVISALTGEPLKVQRQGTRIQVSGIGYEELDEPLTVAITSPTAPPNLPNPTTASNLSASSD